MVEVELAKTFQKLPKEKQLGISKYWLRQLVAYGRNKNKPQSNVHRKKETKKQKNVCKLENCDKPSVQLPRTHNYCSVGHALQDKKKKSLIEKLTD